MDLHLKGRKAVVTGASKGVGAARLHQKSGSSNSFSGYTKVNKGNGSFTMKKTGGSK